MIYVTCVLYLVTGFAIGALGVGSVPSSFQDCEIGWQKYTDNFGSVACFRVHTTPLSWEEARRKCKQDLSYLVNLDRLSTFYRIVIDQPTEFLENDLFQATNGEFWSGMHVGVDSRLMWDAFGPQYVMETSRDSWFWSQGQPAMIDGADECGHVIQGRRIVQPTTLSPDGSGSGEIPFSSTTPETTTVIEVFNNQNTVNLSSCVTELPFVCQKPVVRMQVSRTTFCPDGWLGNQLLPYCMKIVREPATFEEAKRACAEQNGGSIYQAVLNTFNYMMGVRVLQYYMNPETEIDFKPLDQETVWIDGGPILNTELPDQCYALQDLSIEGRQGTAVINCNQQLPYMCMRKTLETVNEAKIEIESPYLDQEEAQSYAPFTILPLTAKFARAPSQNEVIFIQTPTRIFNSSENYFQETEPFPQSRAFRYGLTQSGLQQPPYEVNILLPTYFFNDESFTTGGLGARKKRSDGNIDMSSAKSHLTNALRSKKENKSHMKRHKVSHILKKKHFKKRKGRGRGFVSEGRRHGDRVSGHNGGAFTKADMIELLTKFRSTDNKKKISVAKGRSDKTAMQKKHRKKHHKKSKNGHSRRDNSVLYKLSKVDRRREEEIFNKNAVHQNSILSSDSMSRVKRQFSPSPDLLPNDRDGNAQQVDFNQMIYTTGYYRFGIYTVNPPGYTVTTEPVLLRYTARDWYIYIVKVDMNAFEPFLSPEQVTSFKLYGDISFVEYIGEFANSAMETAPTIGDRNDSQPFRFYRAIPEDITGLTVKFRLFVNIYGSRTVSPNYEQELIPYIDAHWRQELSKSGFDTSTVEVYSTASCPFVVEQFNRTVEVTFPHTPAGELAYSWERCFGGQGAFASRRCLGGYDTGTSWGPVTYAQGCQDFPELPESEVTESLQNLSDIRLNETNFNTVINDTIYLTSPDINLTVTDIILTAEILYNYWTFDGILGEDVLDDIYEVTNNVLEQYQSIINAAQKITNAANRIIETIEEVTSNSRLFGGNTARIVKTFLATEIWAQNGSGDLIIGFQFQNDDEMPSANINETDLFTVQEPSETDVNVTDTAIYLDKSLVANRTTKTAFQIYGKTSLFTTQESSRFELISKVAAARLEVNGVLVTDLGDENVTVIFRPSKEDDRTVCAYWDYDANEAAGGWRTDGCTKTVMTDKRVVCKCNHLTNFAVLVDLEAYKISDTNKLVLEIITKIGLIVSIIGLGITILTFLLFKHLRNGRGQQVLVNLSVAMLCSALIFLVGMDRTESRAGCKVVAALLHYFIMVSFMWMLVEGVLQYLRFVKVLGTYIPNFMLKSMIPAWGIPIIPVVVVAAIDHEKYWGGRGYCWLERDAMLYGFIIPVAVILFANVVVFCLVMVNLFRRRSSGMKSNQSERKMAFLHFQAAVSIFVVLGITWVFGFLAIDGARVVFHYIFAILNAFQGLFIFLLFTAREKQIRKAWRKCCCKDSSGKGLSSSMGTGSDIPRRKTSVDTQSSSGFSNGQLYAQGTNLKPVNFENIGYEP